ncbi:MAG: hypothetical protein M0R03_19790 [Novosphingobium sp.]|nr:hypothetical protein [Novosphingobium sp.]
MPQEISREDYEAMRGGSNPLPVIGKPLGERQMDTLLKPDLPKKDKGPLNKLWIFSGEVTRHVQLTNIPSEHEKHRLELDVMDLERVANWTGSEYLDTLQAEFAFTKLLASKSIAYTRFTRERDALNENRVTQTFRDDRPPVPKNAGGGLFGFLTRG